MNPVSDSLGSVVQARAPFFLDPRLTATALFDGDDLPRAALDRALGGPEGPPLPRPLGDGPPLRSTSGSARRNSGSWLDPGVLESTSSIDRRPPRTRAIRSRASAPSVSSTSAVWASRDSARRGDVSSSRRRAPESVKPSPNTSCLIRSTCSTSDWRYRRGLSCDFCTPMPGNSFSHERSTYGWTPVDSQTSAALYSFGVTGHSIAVLPAVFPAPLADVDADWRPQKTKLFPNLVDQEALVGKVKRGRHVGEKHEGRRRH